MKQARYTFYPYKKSNIFSLSQNEKSLKNVNEMLRTLFQETKFFIFCLVD